MGDAIIEAIGSGLGLMSDLTGEFLNGFTTLFWNADTQTLSTFGTFALIFLGISITFAVVKLCLNILRSNTGA